MNISNLKIYAPTSEATSSTSSSATKVTSDSTTSSSSSSTTDAQEMFLNMLVVELQNQDPTSPMDPNTMVDQMFSMNQLEELISINSELASLVSSSS